MKVTIEPVSDMKIHVNGKLLGIFQVQDKWHGFERLSHPKGTLVIYRKPDSPLADMFPGFFPAHENEEVHIALVSEGIQAILDRVLKKDPEGEPEETESA